jgi:hypothetical protein
MVKSEDAVAVPKLEIRDDLELELVKGSIADWELILDQFNFIFSMDYN